MSRSTQTRTSSTRISSAGRYIRSRTGLSSPRRGDDYCRLAGDGRPRDRPTHPRRHRGPSRKPLEDLQLGRTLASHRSPRASCAPRVFTTLLLGISPERSSQQEERTNQPTLLTDVSFALSKLTRSTESITTSFPHSKNHHT